MSSTGNTTAFVLLDRSVGVEYPASLGQDIELLFGRGAGPAIGAGTPRVVLTESVPGNYHLTSPFAAPRHDLKRGEALTWLMEEIVRALVFDLESGVALHAGAVGLRDRTILVAGRSGAGKTSLVAWLASNGFDYLSDELVGLNGTGEVAPFFRPLVVKPGTRDHVAALAISESAGAIEANDNLLLAPSLSPPSREARQCGFIVFVNFVAEAELSMRPLSAAQCAAKLMEANLNSRNLEHAGLEQLKAMALATPAVSLRYGRFDQLAGTLDQLLRVVVGGGWSASESRKFISALGSDAPALPGPKNPPKPPRPIPKASERRFEGRKLTIGMATYDDYDGVYFTLQALRLYHPEIVDEVEFLVVDNHPDGPHSQALKKLEGPIDNFRYVPFGEWSGGFVKGIVFEQASCPYVLCMDSHVLVVPGGIRRLLDYYADHPDSVDLLQGPLVYDDLAKVATHFNPVWSGGMFGQWSKPEPRDDLGRQPFEIGMHGLGLFSCRKAAWPGFNPAFRGFGGEEGYLHEKFRQAGGRALCLPYLGWVHRFGRPAGAPYPNRWEDRVFNYATGHAELGLPAAEMENHFKELLGEKLAERLLARARNRLADATD
ncbi:glycosyltransferase [Oricola sp.]|uniref:glycosyltransferase n=1 Tax=Oricola sp. TaxID=1979950 RepID=UPI0025DCC827|nr:glycosyltransferase [Oricola sp.]MCI5077439.1 glycosyltransferase [Oricola sp.]